MEKHFLEDMMDGKPGFRPEPWYNSHGDCIVFQIADEAVVAQRVDELLTVYNSALDNRPIGFQIKGVRATLTQFGLDAMLVESQADKGGVKSISIMAMLLAAYENGPRTLSRRKAYAAVLDSPQEARTMPYSELQQLVA